MDYDVVIGLEVHSELKTKTKAFSSAPNEFGKPLNTNITAVCLGLPGALPVLNKKAVEFTVRAGVATNCTINEYSVFERKNYFYPDLPKAYQISQLEFPLCTEGHVDISLEGKTKRIRINRIHLEEDAAKLIHNPMGGSIVDYNRGGVPLIEIVSEPDISSADEAVAYVQALRNILVYTGVSDGKMQEGSLRCDVNLSIKPKGSSVLGTRTEMKNLNSFKAIYRAIQFEEARQIKVLKDGGKIVQETRRWDDITGESFSMRSKEDSEDYRYFPDPDLLPIRVTKEYLELIKSQIPRLPEERVEDYVNKLQLSEYNAKQMVSDIAIANFFEETLKEFDNAKVVSNWIMSDVMRKLKDSDGAEIEILITEQNFAKLLEMVEQKVVSTTAGKTIFDDIWGNHKDPMVSAKELGLLQVSDEQEIMKVVEQTIANNQQSVADFKAGNVRAVTYVIGQVMKEGKGKLNPQVVTKLVNELMAKQ